MSKIIPSEGINTAGVLLMEAGRYVFCYGPHSSSDGVYVLRIGGHREAGESPWQCAAREAREEAGVVVRQVQADASVQTNGHTGSNCEIVTLSGPVILDGYSDERPLVLGCAQVAGKYTSALFLAETDGESHPSNEVFGLVKLTGDEVIQIARVPGTFSRIQSNATAQSPSLSVAGDKPLVLSTHLRALAYCLEMGYA